VDGRIASCKKSQLNSFIVDTRIDIINWRLSETNHDCSCRLVVLLRCSFAWYDAEMGNGRACIWINISFRYRSSQAAQGAQRRYRRARFWKFGSLSCSRELLDGCDIK
jgi:hypothetical protein